MNAMFALISAEWQSGVSHWLFGALLYGTLAAGFTWLLVLTVFRRARPAVHGLLWTLVLVKFLIPFGPGASFSLASVIAGISGWSPAHAPSLATPPGDGSLAFVFVDGAPGAAVPTQPGAAAPAAAPGGAAWLAWLVATYALIVAGLAAARLHAYLQFTRRCRRLPRADVATTEVIEGVCERLGVRRVPAVHVSDSIAAPCVFGLLRPVLVLSTRQLADRTELEAVALHEIAHLRRGDLLVRHFQWLVGTLLFFWPIVAWVNRRIDLVREYACDEWALRHGRLSAGDYARCLLRAVQTTRPAWSHYRPAAMAASRVNVERRIDMILNAQTQVSRRWMWLPIGSAVAVWGAFVLTGAPAVGAAAKEDGAGTWTTESGQTVVVVRGSQLNPAGEPQQQINVEVLAGENGAPGALFLAEGMPHVFIARCNEGDGHAQFGVATIAFSAHNEADLAEFLSQHPSADANGDGALSSVEHDAYLAAQVVADPTAVLNQYPKADRNADGAIDATEAARLIAGGADMDALPIPGGGVWSTAAPAGAGEDGAPRVIKLRRRVNAGEDEAAPKVIQLGEATDGQPRKMIVQRVENPDGTTSVTVTGDAAGEADADVPNILTRAKSFMPASIWVKQNLTADVSAAQVAALVPAVEQAPLAMFLEHNPDADANHDGRLTPEEREAYIERHMSKVREKLLERHPDADANSDGLLTNDELKAYFRDRGPQMGAGADGAKKRVMIMRKDDGGVVTVTEDGSGDEK